MAKLDKLIASTLFSGLIFRRRIDLNFTVPTISLGPYATYQNSVTYYGVPQDFKFVSALLYFSRYSTTTWRLSYGETFLQVIDGAKTLTIYFEVLFLTDRVTLSFSILNGSSTSWDISGYEIKGQVFLHDAAVEPA